LKRLVAEWKYFENHGVSKEIISFSAIDKNSLEHFEAKIRGLTGTPYDNGVFVLDVRITGAYPFSPPKLVFKTKIFHPNINSDGKICLDLLNDQWCVALSFEKVLEGEGVILKDMKTCTKSDIKTAFSIKLLM